MEKFNFELELVFPADGDDLIRATHIMRRLYDNGRPVKTYADGNQWTVAYQAEDRSHALAALTEDLNGVDWDYKEVLTIS